MRDVAFLVKSLYDTMRAWHKAEKVSSSMSLQLQFICLGAEIYMTPELDFLTPELAENLHIDVLRLRENLKKLYSPEEKNFMQNLALILTRKVKSNPWKIFCLVRSFITYNGLFMAPGFEFVSEKSVWPTYASRVELCFCNDCISRMRNGRATYEDDSD